MYLRDGLSSLFWLIIAIFVCVQAVGTGIGNFHNPAPGFLPFWAGIALGFFSIALLINSIGKGKESGGISSLWKGMGWRKVVLILVSLFAYAILLRRLGYILATSGLLVLLFSIMRRERLWVQVVSALIAAGVSYLIFYVWLDVQLPKGILDF